MLKRSLKSKKKLAVDVLFKTAAGMTNKDSVITFARELLTEDEQVTIGRRILIAQMILSGKKQAEIREELGVSPNTFTRTRKWVEKEIPEYGKAIKEYKKQELDRLKKIKKKHYDRTTPFTSSDMRRRYPAHFLLINLIEEIFSSE